MRIRTGYSFRTAAGHLPDVMAQVKVLGWGVAPISDRMSTFGFNRWTKLAKADGLRPIYGVEIPCVVALGEKKPITDCWTFFALESLRPLHDLICLATDNPGKEPSLTYNQALANSGVFVLAGERLLVDALPATPGPNFGVALAPSTPKGLVRRALGRGLRLIASGDNYFPAPEDEEFYRALLGPRRAGTQTYPRHIMKDAELYAWLAEEGHDQSLIDGAFAARDEVLGRCNATMRKAKLLAPEKPKTLRELCIDGAAARNIDLSDPVYEERLNRELGVIEAKKFEDYFYILADLISWARKRMVVGPARGSSCGSLVCYLLGITAIDPIPYDLYFERFLDVTRTDLPDIDSDFSDAKRHLVFEYAEQKYGKERVARLGTVGMFKAKSALNQAGATLHIPKWRTDKVVDSIIERSSADSRAMNSLEDTLNETDAGRAILSEHPELIVAARMEGHPNVSSQHAAGLLITDEPIKEFVAVDGRTGGAWVDKKDAEDLNLLKVDALGLTQLSIFERCLELMNEKPSSEWLEQKIPLDDPAAFEVLNQGHYSGIFQFTGTALRSLAGQIKFDSLEDLIAMSALCRPGPLASGGTTSWIKRKNGQEKPVPIHPALDEMTASTYGIVVYQEQVMRVVREVGKFTFAEANMIRKLMSNRMGDEAFGRHSENFVKGAIESGLTEAEARLVWGQVDTMGSWAFNRAHSVAYGIVSYWCCWLKAHFPVEFAAATLDAQPDPGKQIAILREMRDEGVDYVPIDPETSIDRWSITERNGRKVLVGPLTAIKGIGPAKLQEVLNSRRTGAVLRPSLLKQLQNAKTEIDSLFPIAAAIERLHPDLTAVNIFTKPTPVIEIEPGKQNEVMIIGLLRKISPRDENEDINVAKRGGRILYGPTQSLNLFFADDTEEIFCKIDRMQYERLGRKMLEEAKAGKSIYAIKGTVPRSFRMIAVKAVRYLGEM